MIKQKASGKVTCLENEWMSQQDGALAVLTRMLVLAVLIGLAFVP